MKILYLLILFAIPYISHSQSQLNLCYVSCKQGGCLRDDPLTCTECDQGTILLNNRCASSGSQSQPIRLLQPIGNNILDTSGLPQFNNRNQVSCRRNSGSITYLNVTLSNLQIYTVRIPIIFIKSPHKYINIKFNAVLFNQTNGILSQIRVLMIDGNNDRRIFDGVIQSNEGVLLCGQTSFNMPFFVSVNTSSTSQSLLISISTVRPKDQLGLADLNVFYGNCYVGCASCEGPGPNQCLSCENLLIYVTATKSCSQCPNKFYKVNQLCVACPYNCQTCQYSSRQGGPVCKKCQTGIVNSNSTIPLCQVSQYVNQSLNQLIFQSNDGWKSAATVDDVVTLCGSYSLIGGLIGYGGYPIKKTFYNLPVHKKIWLKFTLFLIDQTPDTTYRDYITVDDVPVGRSQKLVLSSNQLSTNQCGLQKNQFITAVFINDIPHTSSEATISITGQSNYFGIRDFVLGVYNLTDLSTCDQVDLNNKCIRCRNGYRLNPFNQSQPQCTDCPDGAYQSGKTCNICPVYCRTCRQVSGLIPCLSCDAPLVHDAQSGTCIDKESSLYTAALSQNWNSSVTGKQWKFTPKLQNKGLDKCGPFQILGSTSIKYRNLTMSRNFQNLPNHQGVYVHLYLFILDNFNANNLRGPEFKFNNKVIPYTLLANGYDICGNNSFDSVQKLVLYDPNHSASNLNLDIAASNLKFGISNLLVFLSRCQECKNYGISYDLQTIPMYSASSTPNPDEKGLKTKIVFNQRVYITKNQTELFKVQLVERDSPQIQALKGYFLAQTSDIFFFNPRNTNGSFGRGEKDPYAITNSYFHANRELVLYQNLIKDQYNKDALAHLLSPDSAYGQRNDNLNLIQSLRIQPVLGQFSRYDDIYSVIDTQNEGGQKYRANTRNLMNLFRGISILALFIGLISFFFNVSDIFDDLFLLCQIIFVHIFIQSPWISATMKLPVGAMNLVQFMAWLPVQARNSIQRGIIPQNHYQRSPIVYEQYWRDISFARTIYHTVIFLAAMLIYFWFIRLIRAIRQPSINKVMQISHIKYHYAQNFLYGQTSRWFVFLDRVIRFTFFTVMWASCLQFIHFYNQPSGFMGWNSALCIFMFVFYILYVILGYFYLNSQAKITQSMTFRQKFGGVRIKKQRLWYFVFRYFKLLAIAFIIGQLYNVNPLAVLIPLIFIHIIDTVILIVFKPYLDDTTDEQHIVSKCTKRYWFGYWISHIVQNLLFVVLEIIMIIMYGNRSKANKYEYLNIGYACCAFIIILFILGLYRLIHGFIRFFEICYDDISGRKHQVQSQQDIGPLQFLDLMRANQNNTDVFQQAETNRNLAGRRRPSIDNKI